MASVFNEIKVKQNKQTNKRVGGQLMYLGEFVLPLVTHVSIILIIQMICFVGVDASKHSDKPGVTATFLFVKT